MTTSGGSAAAPPAHEAVSRIIADFRTMVREIRCVGSERLVRKGVSMGHLQLMSLLDRHGEMAMSRLAELLDVSVSNATGLVDRMEERGLIERRRVADDRRLVLVRVTEVGRQAMAELEILRNDLLTRILGQLDDGQLARLAASLDDLRAAVADAIRDDPDLLHHAHGTDAAPTIPTENR
jgi:DNA-binding MarR family transcriptional regulator